MSVIKLKQHKQIRSPAEKTARDSRMPPQSDGIAIRASNFALLHRINTLYGEVNKFLVQRFAVGDKRHASLSRAVTLLLRHSAATLFGALTQFGASTWKLRPRSGVLKRDHLERDYFSALFTVRDSESLRLLCSLFTDGISKAFAANSRGNLLTAWIRSAPSVVCTSVEPLLRQTDARPLPRPPSPPFSRRFTIESSRIRSADEQRCNAIDGVYNEHASVLWQHD